MILLIDLGNTRIKWAELSQGQILFGGAKAHKKQNLSELMPEMWSHLSKPESIWVANVAGDSFSSEMQQWFEKNWNMQAHFVNSSSHYADVKNTYQHAEKLGVDRWLNLIAAREQIKEPVCIVDCGSFLTIDIMDETGQHQGGYITSGLDMMYAALSYYSQGRLTVTIEQHENLAGLGTSTRECIVKGCCQMLVAFINRVTAQTAEKFGDKTQFIITGGDTALLMPFLTQAYHQRPALVFEGLALLAQKK